MTYIRVNTASTGSSITSIDYFVDFFYSEALARGTKWVGMVGEMVMVSVGPLDQVVAIQVNF